MDGMFLFIGGWNDGFKVICIIGVDLSDDWKEFLNFLEVMIFVCCYVFN